MLTILKDVFGKESITGRGVDAAVARVEVIMNRNISKYKKISLMFNASGNNKLGATEYVSDPRLIKHMIESDFVIFNNGCKVLDAYGSKVGEFADYILNNDRVKTEKGFVDSKNYYILCYTHLTYEMNKFVLMEMGVPEKNILFCNNVKEIEENLGTMTFQVIVGNPPYKGSGNPLYMRITKSIYEHNMDENSVMCMIHPTALVDNKYEKDDRYKTNKKLYGDLGLVDFYYDPSIKGSFVSTEINNDLGIFTYMHTKEKDKSIYSEWVKEKRFGDEQYKKDKDIINKILKKTTIFLDKYHYSVFIPDKSFFDTFENRLSDDSFYVVCGVVIGNLDNTTNTKKWDWVNLQTPTYIRVKTKKELNKIGMHLFDFNNKSDAVKFIQWINTDFIHYLVMWFKCAKKNNKVIFEYLPSPPKSGDFSDESLCKEFGLDMKTMKDIHESMKNFGYRSKDTDYLEKSIMSDGITKFPSIKLDGTQDTLLKYIEELNRINDGVDTSSYVSEEEEDNEEYSETDTEPESSPSSSESLPKSIYDLDTERLKPDADESEKYDEDELINAYPKWYERYEEDGGDDSFIYWLYKKVKR